MWTGEGEMYGLTGYMLVGKDMQRYYSTVPLRLDFDFNRFKNV